MYKKCENCYKDGKVPNEESCKKCEDDLKRKEQECEELREQLKEMNEVIRTETTRCSLVNSLKTELDQLKAENDYLKHKIFRYEEIFKHSADMTKNPVTAIELEIFQSGVRALGNSLIAEENNKLHKTLAEIKEIAEHCMKQDICTICDYSDRCHIEDEEIPTYDVCKLILQKISEVEE